MTEQTEITKHEEATQIIGQGFYLFGHLSFWLLKKRTVAEPQYRSVAAADFSQFTVLTFSSGQTTWPLPFPRGHAMMPRLNQRSYKHSYKAIRA
jgi:hypothetical protein